MNQSLYVNWPSSLVLLGELALELSEELEQAEALRRLVRLHFRNGERAADAVEEGEGAAEASRVALSAINRVEPKLLDEAVGGEIEVHALRRVDNLLARCFSKGRRVVDMRAEGARVEPDAVRLRRINPKQMVLRVEVEGFLELEAREGLQVLLLRERADDRRAELESFREARTLVLRTDARREHLLRARDEVLGLDRKVRREEQGLVVALGREGGAHGGHRYEGRGCVPRGRIRVLRAGRRPAPEGGVPEGPRELQARGNLRPQRAVPFVSG